MMAARLSLTNLLDQSDEMMTLGQQQSKFLLFSHISSTALFH